MDRDPHDAQSNHPAASAWLSQRIVWLTRLMDAAWNRYLATRDPLHYEEFAHLKRRRERALAAVRREPR